MFHELVLFHLIVPGNRSSPCQWPHYTLTEDGRVIVRNPGDATFDAAAYLDQLQQRVPSLDSDVAFYIGQSMSCYRARLIPAAAVMLGTACEKMLRDFTQAVVAAQVSAEARESLLRAVSSATAINDIYEVLARGLEAVAPLFPQKIADAIERELEACLAANYYLVRRVRGDAGQPILCSPTVDDILSAMLLFPIHAELLYEIVDILRSGTHQ